MKYYKYEFTSSGEKFYALRISSNSFACHESFNTDSDRENYLNKEKKWYSTNGEMCEEVIPDYGEIKKWKIIMSKYTPRFTRLDDRIVCYW